MGDFCDGQYFKQHPVFKDNPNALQFIIYYDDIKVANPLGARSGTKMQGMLNHSRRNASKGIMDFKIIFTDLHAVSCQGISHLQSSRSPGTFEAY